jgi:hypothetical protein
MLENWSELRRTRFPVIFHAVAGQDAREAFSPSYFNVDEITQVKQYIKLLLENSRIGECFASRKLWRLQHNNINISQIPRILV